MKKLIVICLACAAELFTAAASAEPGELWKVTSKTEMPNMPMAIPATTMQVCLPRGGASDPRKSAPNKECKITDIKKRGSKTSWKMRCDQDGEVMTGSGEVTVAKTSYKGVMHLKGKSHGQNIDMTTHYSGKKLGKSCDASQPARQMTEAPKPAEKKPGSSSSSSTQSMDSGEALQKGADKLKGLLGF